MLSKCGKIFKSLKFLDKSKEYVLSIDSKKIATGFTKTGGDIDLWGYETPSLKEEEKRDKNLKMVQLIEESSSETMDNEELKLLPKLLQILTGYLCQI